MLPQNKELLCLWRIVLSFCLKTTQFACKGPYYQQVFVTAMGSPVSAVIANMVMEDVEQRALATSLVKPFFWKRYVDDVISPVSGNEAEPLLLHLNSLEPSIQCILEREMAQRNVEWYSVHKNSVALCEMAQRNVEWYSVHTNSVALREMA